MRLFKTVFGVHAQVPFSQTNSGGFQNTSLIRKIRVLKLILIFQELQDIQHAPEEHNLAYLKRLLPGARNTISAVELPAGGTPSG